MKKYVVRFTIVLLGYIFLFNFLISKEYKNVYADNSGNVEIKMLEQFIDGFSVIPEEVKEAYYEDFVLLDVPLSQELQEYAFEMCKKYDESYSLVIPIIATESDFKINAECKNETDEFYSKGLMQLNERYLDEFIELTGIEDFNIMNPKHNIEGGVAKIHNLRMLWSKYELSDEDMFLAITNSYNLGFDKYKNAVIKRGYFFSRNYDRKVLENKIKLEENGGI